MIRTERTPEERKAAKRAQALARYYRNRKEYAERNANWRRANPEYVRATETNRRAIRRARLRGATTERVDRRVVLERDGGVCHICTLSVDPTSWHLDHVIPLSRGGEHSYANVATSHPYCNESKGARL